MTQEEPQQAAQDLLSRPAPAGAPRAAVRLDTGEAAALLQSMPVALVSLDGALRITYANALGESLLGRPLAELSGVDAFEVLPTGTASWLRDAIDRARRTQAAVTVEGTGAEAGQWLEVTVDPTQRGLSVYLRDVTERNRAEQRLVEAETKYRALVEQVPAVIYIDSVDGHSIYVSPRIEDLLDYSPEELVADPDLWIECIHSDDAAHVLAEEEHADRTGEPFSLEYRMVSRQGHVSWVRDEAMLVRDEAGTPLFWRGVIVDVSALKRVEEELQRSLERLSMISEERSLLLSRLVDAQERERTRIASDIHDDSVQVMTAVSLRLNTLRRHISDPDQVALLERLDQTVTEAVGRLRRLMFDLRPLALERDGLATAVEAWLSQAAVDGGFEYSVSNRLLEEPPEEVRVTLYRLCAEALANARKHARASTISVTLESREQGVLVTVRDDGIGFDIESGERKRDLGHLGLSAIRERCRLSGGWCEIESAPGAGTTVRFWIPPFLVAA